MTIYRIKYNIIIFYVNVNCSIILFHLSKNSWQHRRFPTADFSNNCDKTAFRNIDLYPEIMNIYHDWFVKHYLLI